jgi:hypothetical protein
MKILLTDASGLTSRQVTTILSRHGGHEIHILSPPGLSLTKLTSHTPKHRIHTVPPFGIDPYAWLGALLIVLKNEKSNSTEKNGFGKPFDILLPTQEQIAILAAERRLVEATGVKMAVPSFEALRKVMGKIETVESIREAGLLQPESVVLRGRDGVGKCEHLLPGYLKTGIGTASQGVKRVESVEDVGDAIKAFVDEGLRNGSVSDRNGAKGEKLLLQKEIKGSLLMICGVFERGTLRAWHACVRVHEGVNGGASKKVSLPLPVVGEQLSTLGKSLEWHGALSLDAILEDGKLWIIDINPRIVEPMNALLSGIDLVGALLDVSLGKPFEGGKVKHGIEGVETHQFVLALLKKAQEGRILVLVEVFKAVMGFERYAGSVEELTPISGDWISLFILMGFVLVLLIGGKRAAEWIAGGAVKGYALSAEGWRVICEREDGKAGTG